MKDQDSIFLICDCYEHGLLVEKFNDENEVSLSLFERGLKGRTLCWSERLRWCWSNYLAILGNYGGWATNKL